MTSTTLTQFLARVASDSRLQDQLKGVTEKTRFAQTLVRLGKENGFHFTAEDVDVALVQNKKNPLDELSEVDLALVAGGRPPATKDGCGDAWTTIFGPCS